jgi:hypothetical protein
MGKNGWQKDKTVGKRRMRWQKNYWQKNEDLDLLAKR